MNAATQYRRGHWPTKTAGALGLWALLSAAFLGCSQPAPPPPIPQNSADLSSTVIVPTLDTPLPENKSAIWCCSFQLAWDELKANVVREPVHLENAEEVAERLNRGEFSKEHLPDGAYYAAAGFYTDGIRDRIGADMKRMVPGESYPDLGERADGAAAFAFLKAGLEFNTPYPINPNLLAFKARGGQETNVRSIACLASTPQTESARGQLKILCYEEQARSRVPKSFALDLCSTSKPNQLIVAVLDRQATLAETLADLEEKMKETLDERKSTHIYPDDSFIVPCMKWRLDHHFKEVEGRDKPFLNPGLKGMHLDTAMQTIDFRLDGTGVALKSGAAISVKGRREMDFHCDRPFLLVLKKRDAKQPFFVMWLDNAEMLEKQ
jgi:hypothetical protein